MPDEAPDSAPTVVAVVDDARQGAVGLRGAAMWVAGAIAGIPTLAILATILKPPDGAAFEPVLPSIGIFLSVLGALLGIVALARVFEPVMTEDADLRGSSLGRIPEAVDDSYDALLIRIQGDHRHAALARTRSADEQVYAAPAEAELAEAEHRLKQAEEALKDDAANPAKLRYAAKARIRLSAASASAAQAKGRAQAALRASEVANAHLGDGLTIRRAAFQLAAADTVRSRYKAAMENTLGAGAIAAIGIALILLASQVEEEEPASPSPDAISVVTLRLNPVGQAELGCTGVTSLEALLLKEDKTAPTVITFPVTGCPSRKVIFRLEKKPLGKLEPEAAVGG